MTFKCIEIEIPLKLTVMFSSNWQDARNTKVNKYWEWILDSNLDNVHFTLRDKEEFENLRPNALRQFLENLGTWYMCEDLDFHVLAIKPNKKINIRQATMELS